MLRWPSDPHAVSALQSTGAEATRKTGPKFCETSMNCRRHLTNDGKLLAEPVTIEQLVTANELIAAGHLRPKTEDTRCLNVD
uniref:Uncharacterized protein n=3 Tax=unclassified Arthrobacter TaxID=235627 RepID=I3W120_9MICC|nr:hypothetical protein [Arthrobacter sp. J3.37]AFK89297.1 hypothetical protein [Arthrobacter sp. J3.40]